MSVFTSGIAIYPKADHLKESFEVRNETSESLDVACKKAGLVAENERVVERGLTYNADEIWLYAPLGRARNLLFIVQESVVVTVLYAESYRLDVSGVRRCSKCGAIDEIVVADGCSYCSETVQKIKEGRC